MTEFRVEFFVTEKHVADVHIFAAGRALLHPPLSVRPVENARLEGGRLVSKTKGGTACERLHQHVIENKITSITPKQIATVLNVKSPTHAAKCGVKAGFLKKVGKGIGVKYQVLIAHPRKNKKVK